MRKFTTEEIDLLSIYIDSSKQETLENIVSALPYMDTHMQKFAQRVMKNVKALSKEDYAELVSLLNDVK